ncbi:MAG TPA: pyridoxamine 5'-phosphate oxidase family protein [Bacteroidales bacterium]|nr:pyridoxamine 5'-phosphate oxidase family protein [Bacteroidales bacterium]
MMTFQECIDYIKRNPTGFLATAIGDIPHVRPMTVWLADETGIYFYTSSVEHLMSQLNANQKIEIAFHEQGTKPDLDSILRIAGTIEFVEDMKIRTLLYETFSWLKTIGTGKPDSPTIVVFRLPRGKFNYWTWENNVNPGPWIDFP